MKKEITTFYYRNSNILDLEMSIRLAKSLGYVSSNENDLSYLMDNGNSINNIKFDSLKKTFELLKEIPDFTSYRADNVTNNINDLFHLLKSDFFYLLGDEVKIFKNGSVSVNITYENQSKIEFTKESFDNLIECRKDFMSK